MRGIEPLSAAWDCYWKEFADYATNMTFFLTELLCSLCTTSPYRVRDGLEPPTTSLAWNERLLFGSQTWSIFFVLYQLSYLTHVIGASSWFIRTFAPSPWLERVGFEPTLHLFPSVLFAVCITEMIRFHNVNCVYQFRHLSIFCFIRRSDYLCVSSHNLFA